MPTKNKSDTPPADQAQTAAEQPPHLAPGAPADQDARAALEAAAPPQLRLRALHPVRHDGTRYGPGLPAGDEFSADDATAAELSGLGVVELLGEESPE